MLALTIVDRRLVVQERPDPQPGEGQLLVRVRSAGLNRADLWQRAGGYPPPPGYPPDIPGLEFAGTVVETGPGCSRFRSGDAVMGLVGGGAQATLVAVHEVHCVPVPRGLDSIQAGGVPEVYITAHDALVSQAQARSGEKVLVQAVGSGVGVAAIQLAKRSGCTVFGTSRTAAKLEQCRRLGLDRGILLPGEDIPGDWADVVLDLVGGSYLALDIDAATSLGRIVMLSTVGGDLAEVNLRVFMNRRLRLHGSVLRARPVAEKALAIAAFERDCLSDFEDGRLVPVIEKVVPLDHVEEAYELLDSGTVVGKVVLAMPA